MLMNTQIPQPLVNSESLAQFCKASADELRVNVLRILHNDSFSVQELCLIFDLKQSAMSHHLKVLAAAQLATTRREGNTIYYRRRLFSHDHPLAQLQKSLFNSIDKCPLNHTVLDGMQIVAENRVHSSKAFFLDNTDKFREQQDLIANFGQYVDSVETLLKAVSLPSTQHAIEIGPGEGLFLKILSKIFTSVTAFDTSSTMLRQANQLIHKQRLENITLITGDTRVAVAQAITTDCIVINMVLHHVARPANVFQDASQLLKPGGALIITDLCHHDQSWAKEACGDVWLGFEPEDLSLWAKQAGLEEGQSSYLAQRNGFRIQIRHFYKSEEH